MQLPMRKVVILKLSASWVPMTPKPMDLIKENYPYQTSDNGYSSLLALHNFLPNANQKYCLEDMNALHNEL